VKIPNPVPLIFQAHEWAQTRGPGYFLARRFSVSFYYYLPILRREGAKKVHLWGAPRSNLPPNKISEQISYSFLTRWRAAWSTYLTGKNTDSDRCQKR